MGVWKTMQIAMQFKRVLNGDGNKKQIHNHLLRHLQSAVNIIIYGFGIWGNGN